MLHPSRRRRFRKSVLIRNACKGIPYGSVEAAAVFFHSESAPTAHRHLVAFAFSAVLAVRPLLRDLGMLSPHKASLFFGFEWHNVNRDESERKGLLVIGPGAGSGWLPLRLGYQFLVSFSSRFGDISLLPGRIPVVLVPDEVSG